MWHGLTMKPEAKAQWLADLRSGDFKKTQNFLKKQLKNGKFRYCCMGVFSERQGVPEKEPDSEGEVYFQFPNKESRGGNIRSDVPAYAWFEEFFDFDETGKEAPTNKHFAIDLLIPELANMNDGNYQAPKSFRQIANWIERNL